MMFTSLYVGHEPYLLKGDGLVPTKPERYQGKVAVKASGYFAIATATSTVTDIAARYCRKLHRSDGYSYQKGDRAFPHSPEGDGFPARIHMVAQMPTATQRQHPYRPFLWFVLLVAVVVAGCATSAAPVIVVTPGPLLPTVYAVTGTIAFPVTVG